MTLKLYCKGKKNKEEGIVKKILKMTVIVKDEDFTVILILNGTIPSS